MLDDRFCLIEVGYPHRTSKLAWIRGCRSTATMTQSEAMQRFLEKMKPLILGNTISRYKSTDEVFEDCFSLIEPFVANPQRHKDALKMIVEGISAQAMMVQLQPFMKMTRVLQKIGVARVDPNLDLIRRIESIRDDLLNSVHPGEFDVDVLPPREKNEAVQGRKLIVFQVNVAVYPLLDFTPQSLSVRLSASHEDIQFEDVNPASRIDAVGSYEIGVTESGKFTETDKDTEKLAFKLDGQVAKLESEIGGETTYGEVESARDKAVCVNSCSTGD
jgi:tetrahydromethanopterin S-methyltransferase subunit B